MIIERQNGNAPRLDAGGWAEGLTYEGFCPLYMISAEYGSLLMGQRTDLLGLESCVLL